MKVARLIASEKLNGRARQLIRSHRFLLGGAVAAQQLRKVLREGKDAGNPVGLSTCHGFRIHWAIWSGEARTRPHVLAGIAAAILTIQRSSIAVIHGCRVDTVLVVTVLAIVTTLAASTVLSTIV